jgi:hypothetical protein
MSDTENPFLITPKRASNSSKRVRYSNVWTQSEKNDKLIGYLEIPLNMWINIKGGSHIRYITKDGLFRTGGFIVKNPVNYTINNDTLIKPSVKPNNLYNNNNDGDNNTVLESDMYLNTNTVLGIRLQNSFNRQLPDYTTWVVSYDDIMKLYLKVDVSIRTVVQSLEDTIENININMRKITDYIKKMDDRLKKIESYVKS